MTLEPLPNSVSDMRAIILEYVNHYSNISYTNGFFQGFVTGVAATALVTIVVEKLH